MSTQPMRDWEVWGSMDDDVGKCDMPERGSEDIWRATTRELACVT